MNKKMGISKFVDIIAKYSHIGKKQEQALKDATRFAFEEHKNGDYPSFKDINDKLAEIYGDKRDTLTEIIDSLSDYELFESKPKIKDSFLSNNYYLSLSGDLPNNVRFTSTFLIINYIYNTFMNMENTPVENGYQGIRYILMIDEAHIIFKEKKSQELLEKILREIRSKGVSVVLLSQGIEEFNQPSFDFSTMCEIVFLLDIKDKTNYRVINKFMGFSDKDGVKALRSLEKIEKGQAISNIKEFDRGELFFLNQFRNNN
jgi:DNA sulfur modification protein DndE